MEQYGNWEEVGGDVQGRRREGLTMGKDVREGKKGLRTGATGGEIVERKEKWHESRGCQIGQKVGWKRRGK